MSEKSRAALDMSFNAASMAAFMLPGYGMVAGIGLMTAPILINMFFPVEEEFDYENALVSNMSLETQLNLLREGINEDRFIADLENARAEIEVLYNDIAYRWQQTFLDVRGKRHSPENAMFRCDEMTERQESDWERSFRLFSDPALKSNHPILNCIQKLKNKPEYYFDTLELFSLAASTWLAYCKLCQSWQFNIDYRKHLKTVEKHNAEVDAFDLEVALVIWQSSGGVDSGEPKPAYPPAPELPPELADVQGNSAFVTPILQHLPGFIQHLKNLALQAQRMIEQRDQDVKKRVRKIKLITSRTEGVNGATYHWEDWFTGTKSQKSSSKALVEKRMAARVGRVRRVRWATMTEMFQLDKVDEDKIGKALQVVAEWEEALFNYSATKEELQAIRDEKRARALRDLKKSRKRVKNSLVIGGYSAARKNAVSGVSLPESVTKRLAKARLKKIDDEIEQLESEIQALNAQKKSGYSRSRRWQRTNRRRRRKTSEASGELQS